jgi:hypothetical protein
LTDVPRTEDPDSPNPNPNPNKFGLMEEFTDVPRTDPDGEPNPNKPRFIQDFTEVPRTEDDRTPMVEVREVIAADSNSTHRLFGSLDKTSGLPNDNIQGTPGNDYLVGKHYRDDAIFGAGGADTLKGLDGDDFLFGGTGHDKVYGGGDVVVDTMAADLTLSFV